MYLSIVFLLAWARKHGFITASVSVPSYLLSKAGTEFRLAQYSCAVSAATRLLSLLLAGPSIAGGEAS